MGSVVFKKRIQHSPPPQLTYFKLRNCPMCGPGVCNQQAQVHVCLVPSERDFLLACLDETHRRCDSLINGSESARRKNSLKKQFRLCSLCCIFHQITYFSRLSSPVGCAYDTTYIYFEVVCVRSTGTYLQGKKLRCVYIFKRERVLF